MPQVIVTEGAAKGLERCRRFLAAKAPAAARRAGQAIEQHFLLLETAPGLGRPLPEMPELRELLIQFGGSGYVALYHHEPADDAVYVLAFRHQKEVGYVADSSAMSDQEREDDQQVTKPRHNIADSLAMPGVADIDFDPPRVTIAPREADFSSRS